MEIASVHRDPKLERSSSPFDMEYAIRACNVEKNKLENDSTWMQFASRGVKKCSRGRSTDEVSRSSSRLCLDGKSTSTFARNFVLSFLSQNLVELAEQRYENSPEKVSPLDRT